jgi:acetyl esterase
MADDSDRQPHPQARALLDTLEQSPMPPTYSLSTTSARALAEEFFAPEDPEPVPDVQEFSVPGPAGELPLTVYYPEGEGPHPTLLFFHGGGWTLCSRATHDNVCRALCNRADCVVVSVGYRLAPEDPFPAGLEDCYAALEWVADYGERFGADPDRIAVGGDSAGGNIAAACTLLARDERDLGEAAPSIVHQALIYPAVASPGIHDFDSYEENGVGYLLEGESVAAYYENYLPDRTQRRNEYAAPLLARDLSDLPPATVVTAGFDPLRDEGRAYADRLRGAGVDVAEHRYEGMIHAFVNFASTMDAANDAFDAVAADLDRSFAAASR